MQAGRAGTIGPFYEKADVPHCGLQLQEKATCIHKELISYYLPKSQNIVYPLRGGRGVFAFFYSSKKPYSYTLGWIFSANIFRVERKSPIRAL